MERVFSPDDRIRRAEEIYAKRRNLRERTRHATVNVQTPKNYKLIKKLILQILICILIYWMFHLVNTTNYSFSQDTLNRVRKLISEDYDFYSVYNNIVQSLNTYLYPNDEEKTEESNKNQDSEKERRKS